MDGRHPKMTRNSLRSLVIGKFPSLKGSRIFLLTISGKLGKAESSFAPIVGWSKGIVPFGARPSELLS
jgi:hypothetical protein